MLGFASGSDRVSRMEQSFGRDATAVEADAAEPLIAFDEDNLFAEISGVERRGVSAWAGANNDDLSVCGLH